jgi:hypothetical protein
MFYKNASSSPESVTPPSSTTSQPNSSGLSLVRSNSRRGELPKRPSPILDLVVIAGRRCSSFFAEAAVLVLVFGILDFFMLKGRIELSWIVGALAISLVLLAASISMDFAAHRWIKAHP